VTCVHPEKRTQRSRFHVFAPNQTLYMAYMALAAALNSHMNNGTCRNLEPKTGKRLYEDCLKMLLCSPFSIQ
jgi:hypothetical protein